MTTKKLIYAPISGRIYLCAVSNEGTCYEKTKRSELALTESALSSSAEKLCEENGVFEFNYRGKRMVMSVKEKK